MAGLSASDPALEPTPGGPSPRADAEAPERVDSGPSMKSRARLMISVAFLIAIPALLIGALRAASAADEVRIFLAAHQMSDQARLLQVRVERTRAALWRFEAEPNIDSGRHLRAVLDDLARAMLDVEEQIAHLGRQDELRVELEKWREALSQEALLDPEAPLRRMRSAVGRVRRAIDPVVVAAPAGQVDPQAFRRAHAALDTVARDVSVLGGYAKELTDRHAELAEQAVSKVGRDQIVLFLLVVFSVPLLLGLGPAWMIGPLVRLRGIAQRIETGRAREIVAAGEDEVAEVSRAIRGALRRLEEADQKQRAKIFEMRRVLRAVLNQVQDAVLILGRGGRIDYANPAAAVLLGRETHHLESSPLDEVCFSPALIAAAEAARAGDIEDKGVDVSIETADGRVAKVHAVLGTVRNQAGEIARVVVVLQR